MRKGEVRRQSIIEASERLFSAKGYLETTVDDILAELQCSKGSFYHYFDSKLSVLTAICEEKVRLWFDAYKKTRVTSTRERLNVLLRCTQPFRPEEEDFLFMLLRLRSRGECAVMEGALRGAQRELVKPEIENLLMILGETGQAHIARPGLEDLVFEIHIAIGDVVELAEVFSGGGNAAGVAVHDEGAFLGLGLFNQLVMGQVFTGGNRIRHGGKGGHDGHEQARGQHKRKKLLHKTGAS